jgi:hypothetical protein
MRVFTQRFIINLINEYGNSTPNYWGLPQRGEKPEWDIFWESINADHPGLTPQGVHELDYTIVCTPTMYITGKYWGDETYLAAATDFVERRNDIYLSPPSALLTCNDNQHPVDLPIIDLCGSLGSRISLENYDKVGHYRASDPDNLVLVPN